MNTKNKLLNHFLMLIVFVIVLGACSVKNESQPALIDLADNRDSLRVLENPHKGWYHHLLDNGIAKYSINDEKLVDKFPGLDHFYLRLAWSYLEPQEGNYKWEVIDSIIAKYVYKGYNIAFRITSKETGGYPDSVGEELNGVNFATPSWVRDAGAKGTVTEVWGEKSWSPDWDDPVYLEKLNQFHQKFAARYDGQPYVSYVDVGSIGEWGEGHTSFSTKIPLTVEEVKANVAIFINNYQHSQIVVTDDLIYYGKDDSEIDELFDYVKVNEIAIRDDSPLVSWYLQNNLETFSVSHPHFFEDTYRSTPSILELQHYHMIKEDGNWNGKNGKQAIDDKSMSGAEIFRGAIKTMHASYIGYHGNMNEWLLDNPDLTNELLNMCGYWYFVRNIELPDAVAPGSEQTISITWENKGVAPAYHPYQLHIKFTGKNNEKIVVINESFNMKWLDGEVEKEDYKITIPNELNSGSYELAIKIYDPLTKRDVDLALKKSIQDNEGFFNVGKMEVK